MAAQVDGGGFVVEKAIGPDLPLKTVFAPCPGGGAGSMILLQEDDVRGGCLALQTIGDGEARDAGAHDDDSFLGHVENQLLSLLQCCSAFCGHFYRTPTVANV